MASNHNTYSPPDIDEADLRYLLERLLVRTSLASEGQDERLDGLLAELRQYLRGRERDPEQLRAFQGRLDDELERFDDRLAEDTRQAGRVSGQLLAAAESSELFRSDSQELKELARDLGPKGLPRHQWLPWLEAFASIAERALAEGGQINGRGRGLLGRLLQRDEITGESPLQTTEAVVPGMNLDDEAAEVAGLHGEDTSQRLRIARRIGELMERVMQQVELPPDAYRRASLLQSRLSDQQDWGLLRQCLDETADLVIGVVSHSQKEFQRFLQRLDERLSSLHSHVSDQSEALAGRQSAASELEQNVQDELTNLDSALGRSSDVAELRSSVSVHIERIAHTVQVYREHENKLDEHLAGQMDAMRDKLLAMEAHCEQVREQLEQERARALTDILTQLPNREFWEERLRFEFDRWQRYGHPLALAVIDIDYFKQVNDSFGHKAGDRVIQLVARALRERLRATDFVARYGGEEFVVLLPGTTLDQALNVVDELRRQVADMPFHFQGEPVRISFSAGVSWFREGSPPDRVFDEADKALYAAKAGGRNRAVGARERSAR